MAKMVSGLLTRTIAWAMALRSMLDLWVMGTMDKQIEKES
jgi:hypothetical protein